jgi:hypothetical protein
MGDQVTRGTTGARGAPKTGKWTMKNSTRPTLNSMHFTNVVYRFESFAVSPFCYHMESFRGHLADFHEQTANTEMLNLT